MTKSGDTIKFPPLLAIVFMVVGALILVLGFLNYLQDGRLSLTIPFGFLGISFGALLYSYAKKNKAPDKPEE